MDGLVIGTARSCGLLGVMLAVGALSLASPAAGAPVLDGTLTTPTRVAAGTNAVLYYLQLHAGAQEERFSVRLRPPRFATAGLLDEGSTIDGPVAIALQGPGTIGERVTDGGFFSPCSVSGGDRHGYATGDTSVDLLLPPGGRSTLAVRYRIGRRSPWANTDARLTFTLMPTLVGTYAASSRFAAGPTATARQTLRTDGPTIAGPVGAHLLLSTAPQGTTGSIDRAPRRIARRSPVRISGRVLPPAAGKAVVVRWARGSGALHDLPRVRTDRTGHFTAPAFRPPTSGSYELSARYPTQSGLLLGDRTSCPVRFRVP